MERTSAHNPERLILHPDEQYRIVASSVLFDSLRLVGEDLANHTPTFKPSPEAGVALGVCELAYKNPAAIETYLQQEYNLGLHYGYTNEDGSSTASPRVFHVENVGVDLQIVDSNMYFTPQFTAALGRAANNKDWSKVCRVNNMERFESVQEDIFNYVTADLLPVTNNGTLTGRFLNILRDAEFYAGQYDPAR